MPRGRHRKVVLPAGHGRKKLSFALTPLADAMFQLLIFFMLSSTLAPYSLITLTPGDIGAASAAPATPVAPPGAPAIWHLGSRSVRMGTERVALDRIGELIAAMKAGGIAQVVVFTDAEARVQDVATALNALTLAQFGSVQLISAEGG